MNIDKDIEIVKDLGLEYYVVNKKRTKITFKESQAIENVLNELETYKKIAYKLAEHIDKNGFCVGGDCIEKCKQHFIEWARKEVEKYDR